MQNKKNILMLLFVLFAAYFSLHGITYEKAVLDNTIAVCCDNNQCNYNDCVKDSECITDPGCFHVQDCYDCIDYYSGSQWCWDWPTIDGPDIKKYWGNGVIEWTNLAVSISGPSSIHVPINKGLEYATYTANASGGDGNYSYSWSVGPGLWFTGGSTGTSFTVYRGPAEPPSWTSYVSVTVTIGNGQTVSATKSIECIVDNNP